MPPDSLADTREGHGAGDIQQCCPGSCQVHHIKRARDGVYCKAVGISNPLSLTLPPLGGANKEKDVIDENKGQINS